jgi:tetratricopeptide (TPR) repeat protein
MLTFFYNLYYIRKYMVKGRFSSGYGARFQRKQAVHKAVLSLVILILVALIPVFLINVKFASVNERKELRELFESSAFEEAFTRSREGLSERPFDFFLLTLHGFSAYQLGISQINTFDTLKFIDECIWSLRKAMLLKQSAGDGRIYYVLGKAYYYKGRDYADLAVQYLEKARAVSYPAQDISQYLGLAYAAVHDYRNSVAAFTLALNPEGTGRAEGNGSGDTHDGSLPDKGPSDLLLLAIARSYIALEELDAAMAYLVRCTETSRDAASRLTARLLLGEILQKNGDSEGAEAQYMTILDEAGEQAEARYQLGELYAARGDTTRARAEWRRAVRADPAHGKARTRLNI